MSIEKLLIITVLRIKFRFWDIKNVFNYIKKANCVISSSLWEDPGFIL